MSPWQLVECAQETDEVIDLSALTFTSDGAVKETPPSQEKAANGGSTEKEEGTRVPEITDEQAAAFLKKLTPAMLVELLNKPEAAPQSPDDQKPTDEDKAEDKPIAPVVQLPTAPPAPVAVAASQVDEGKHIDLAQVEMATRVDQLTIQLAQVEAREAAARWENESQSLVRDFGVPPAVVAQVEPLLKGGKHLIELSDGTSVNAGDVVRGVLHTIAKTWGKAVDLSGPIGSAHEAEMDTAAAERKRIHEIARASGVGR
jgi:type IV pilus biogenesis protein CpaD/CtpE